MIESGKSIIAGAGDIRTSEIKSISRNYMRDESDGPVEFSTKIGKVRHTLQITLDEQVLNVSEMYRALCAVRNAVGARYYNFADAALLAVVADLETVVTFARAHYARADVLKSMVISFANIHPYMMEGKKDLREGNLRILERMIGSTPVLKNLQTVSSFMLFQLWLGRVDDMYPYLSSIDKTYAALRDLARQDHE